MSGTMRPEGGRCAVGRVPAGRTGRVRRTSMPGSDAVRDFIERRARRVNGAAAVADSAPRRSRWADDVSAGFAPVTAGTMPPSAATPDAFGWPVAGVSGAPSTRRPVDTAPSGRPGRSGERGASVGTQRGMRPIDGEPGSASASSRAGRPGALRRPGAKPHGPGAKPHRSGAKPHPPIRLTRRGRLVVLVALLILCGIAVIIAAAPGRAADPARPQVSAVVQPGDTLWSFAERNVPDRSPPVAIDEIRRLNKLEGYVIHPGERLLLPRRR